MRRTPNGKAGSEPRQLTVIDVLQAAKRAVPGSVEKPTIRQPLDGGSPVRAKTMLDAESMTGAEGQQPAPLIILVVDDEVLVRVLGLRHPDGWRPPRT